MSKRHRIGGRIPAILHKDQFDEDSSHCNEKSMRLSGGGEGGGGTTDTSQPSTQKRVNALKCMDFLGMKHEHYPIDNFGVSSSTKNSWLLHYMLCYRK